VHNHFEPSTGFRLYFALIYNCKISIAMPLRSPFILATIFFLSICCGCKLSNNKVENGDSTGTPATSHVADTSATSLQPPAWILQGNIYEVNVRQYTQEGTFNAFAASLDRLKQMGVQTLWFMPINPISKKDRKGTMGSYYAVANYTATNPEFGTLDDFKNLVQKAHSMGFKVIIDWVPNHTGADHYWLTQHPDFYVKDSSGQPVAPYDWTDTRKLDYNNPVVVDSMINSMKFWLTNADIDGFRCDVAGDVPDAFWSKAIPALHQTKQDIFMLAEGNKPSLHKDGFNASYGWDLMNMMYKIAAGQRPAYGVDSVLNSIDTAYPANALKMYFTSNHDENSWNKADYGTYPGASHAAFAVLSQTVGRSIPLIYSGQEEPVLRAIQFFEKDPISWGKYSRAKFYQTLLELRKNNAALASDAKFTKVDAGSPTALYAFTKEKGGRKVLVIVNLSKQGQTVHIADKSLDKKAHNIFLMNEESPAAQDWKIDPWGYAIYVY
jgi:alpha-amylase